MIKVNCGTTFTAFSSKYRITFITNIKKTLCLLHCAETEGSTYHLSIITILLYHCRRYQ